MNTKTRLYFLYSLSVIALGGGMVMSGCQNQADQSTLDAAPTPKADAVKPPPVTNKKGQGSMSAAPTTPQSGTASATK